MVGLSPFAIAPAYGSTGAPAGSASTNPTVTVATFSLLPANAVVGQRVAVTAESGLSGVVCVNTATNTWKLETVTCAESAIPALGATADTWYSSGGITVTAADGCTLYDSTYGRSLRWWPASALGTDGGWLPSVGYSGSNRQLIGWLTGAESAATSNAVLKTQGWATVTETGTGTVATNGTAIALTTSSSGAVSQADIRAPGSSITASNRFYASGYWRVSTYTQSNNAVSNIRALDAGKNMLWGRQTGGTLTAFNVSTDLNGTNNKRSADTLATERFVELSSDGTMVTLRVDGGLFASCLYSAFAGTGSTGSIMLAASNGAGDAVTMLVRRWSWFTWT